MIELPKSYIIWDLESSGFSFTENHILEVAVVKVVDGVIASEWSSIINHNVEIDPRVTEIHGLTQEICAAEGKDPKEILMRIYDDIVSCEAHVTHNGSRFDIPFLAEALRGLGIDDFAGMAHDKHIDTAALYKGDKMGWGKDTGETDEAYYRRVLNQPMKGLKYNVGACCDDLGISREGIQQHRALADVMLTHEILKHLAA